MPTFQFEAMDATGAEIKDVIEAPTEEEAQATIRQMGYFVTKITAKKARKKADTAGAKKKRGFVFGGVKSTVLQHEQRGRGAQREPVDSGCRGVRQRAAR